MVEDNKDLKIFSSAYLMFSDIVRLFYMNSIKELEKLDLKASDAQFIHFLSDFQGSSQKELCDIYGLSPSRMSEMISSLENRGLINRKINPENRRIFQITLTSEGIKKVQEIRELFEDYCKNCLRNFTQEEVTNLETLLLRFNK